MISFSSVFFLRVTFLLLRSLSAVSNKYNYTDCLDEYKILATPLQMTNEEIGAMFLPMNVWYLI